MDGGPSRNRIVAVLAVALAAISVAAVFIRMADAPGVVVAMWRMAIAALVLLPITIRALRRTPLRRANAWPTLWAGVLLGVHFATWISSLSYTTVAASVSLVATTPLWVALLSWAFLRRAPTLSVLLGVLVAVAGGAVIAFGDLVGAVHGRPAPAPLLGDALALVGAIALAGYLLLGRAAQQRGLGIDAYAGVAYTVAAVVLLPLPALVGASYVAYPAATFGWILALALIPQLIGHTGINYAMRHLDPTRVATAALLEPLGAALLALALFAEVPSPTTAIGAAVLLVGVLLTVRTGR
ncbi:MAG: DMT family transporter [bacterium]|nr:DMT family transporter [bacterium]